MTQSVEGVDFATIKEAVDYLKANGYERFLKTGAKA